MNEAERERWSELRGALQALRHEVVALSGERCALEAERAHFLQQTRRQAESGESYLKQVAQRAAQRIEAIETICWGYATGSEMMRRAVADMLGLPSTGLVRVDEVFTRLLDADVETRACLRTLVMTDR